MNTQLLQFALKLDALATAAVGVLAVAGANLLDETLGIATPIMVGVGLFLVAFAAAVWSVSRRATPGVAVRWVIGVNLVWAVDSLAVAALVDLPALGRVLVAAQALAVFGFAALQVAGLRRAQASDTAGFTMASAPNLQS